MEDQEVKRRCFDSELGQDFISNLPQSLKENILMRLNIIEAVRTCILSQRWRYTWCTMPNLVIRTARFNVVDKDGKLDINKFIHSLISHHKGPITKFILSVQNFHYDDLESWIHGLGNKGVRDLYFKFDMTDDSCEIPTSLFSSAPALTDFKIRSHTLDVPQVFTGFKLLRKLCLQLATMDCADLERLVPRCHLLRYLKLQILFESFDNLVIRSQSLKKIVVVANCKHFVLDTPKLSWLNVMPIDSLFNKRKFKQVRVSYQTYTDGLLDRKSSTCLMVYLLKTMPQKLPLKLNHLTRTFIRLNVSQKSDRVAALLLFKCAPKLQKLHVQLLDDSDLGASSNFKSFWESEANNVSFNDLKTVIIEPRGTQTADSTIVITKYILSTAHALEYMMIKDMWVTFMVNAMENPPMLESVSRSDQGMMGRAMATVLEVLKLPRMSNKAHIAFGD